MRIAHIFQTSLDSSQGGVAAYLRNIIPRQLNAGHEVKAVTSKRYKQFGNYSLPFADLNLFGNRKIGSLSHSLNANLQLSFIDFDILHYHSVVSAFFSFIPAMAGKKRVLTLHGRAEAIKKLKSSDLAVRQLINKAVIPNMDAITVVTPYLKKFMAEKYRRESTYLPHGFEASETLAANIIQREFGLTKGSYYLAVGRLTSGKGLDTIIRAYKLIPATSKRLVIAGPPEKDYFNYLRSLIPEDFRDRIIFTGVVGGDKLTELYSNAFLYVAGIETTGLSLTILEAVANKAPVITSRIPENNYDINEHTHKFENKNPADLSALMFRLENNPRERLKFVDSASKCAVANHSWDSVSDAFISIYNKALGN